MGLLTNSDKEIRLSWYDLFGCKFGIMNTIGIGMDVYLGKHMQDMKMTRKDFWKGSEGVIRTILKCMGDDAVEYVGEYINGIRKSGIVDSKNVFLQEPGSISEIYTRCAEQEILSFDDRIIVPFDVYLGMAHGCMPDFENVIMSFGVALIKNRCFRAMKETDLLYLYSFAQNQLTTYISGIYL